MDRITIRIETDIDQPGGGNVVDLSVADLGTGPGGVPLLQLVAGAFADAYGIHAIPNVEDPEAEPTPVGPYKNVSYHVRQFITNITLDYASKQIDSQAAAQKAAVKESALSAVTVAGDAE